MISAVQVVPRVETKLYSDQPWKSKVWFFLIFVKKLIKMINENLGNGRWVAASDYFERFGGKSASSDC